MAPKPTNGAPTTKIHTVKQLCSMLDFELEISLIGPQANVPDADLIALEKFTIHGTANTKPGTDARMHNKFIRNGGGPERVSFTFGVDDKRAVQNLRLTQANYAQGGNGRGNYRSISVEMCEASDQDFEKTIDNTAKLVAACLYYLGQTVDILVQHNFWYGKNCPPKLRRIPGGWEDLKRRIQKYMNDLDRMINPAPEVPIPPVEEKLNGHIVYGNIYKYWKANGGTPVFGLPVSDEFDQVLEGQPYRVQYFERARLECSRTGEVTRGLVGAELFNKIRGDIEYIGA